MTVSRETQDERVAATELRTVLIEWAHTQRCLEYGCDNSCPSRSGLAALASLVARLERVEEALEIAKLCIQGDSPLSAKMIALRHIDAALALPLNTEENKHEI